MRNQVAACYKGHVTDELEMSDEMLAQLIRDAARRVREGREAQKERTRLILEAGRRNLPHAVVAEWAEVTRQAVTKAVNNKAKKGRRTRKPSKPKTTE